VKQFSENADNLYVKSDDVIGPLLQDHTLKKSTTKTSQFSLFTRLFPNLDLILGQFHHPIGALTIIVCHKSVSPTKPCPTSQVHTTRSYVQLFYSTLYGKCNSMFSVTLLSQKLLVKWCWNWPPPLNKRLQCCTLPRKAFFELEWESEKKAGERETCNDDNDDSTHLSSSRWNIDCCSCVHLSLSLSLPLLFLSISLLLSHTHTLSLTLSNSNTYTICSVWFLSEI